MNLTDPIVWQGLAATGLGTLVVLGSAWWLSLSPVQPSRAMSLPTSSPRLLTWLVLALGLAALQFVVGGLWDASRHIKTGLVVGGADFLWPSHLVLYGSFLLALLAASTAMAVVALPAWRRGIRDPRLWVRPCLDDLLSMQDELAALFARSVDLLERQALEQDRNYLLRRHVLEHLEPGLGSIDVIRAARAAAERHLRAHTAAERARAKLRNALPYLPAAQRRLLVRDVYTDLLHQWGDQDRRGSYSIEEALGSVAMHRLGQEANACGAPDCRHLATTAESPAPG